MNDRVREVMRGRMMKSDMITTALDIFCPNGYMIDENVIVATRKNRFNTLEPREWQKQPIKDMCFGRSIIVQAKVGSGKGVIIENSICYSGLIGYICMPTIALCLDMKKRLEKIGAKVCVWSSVSTKHQKTHFKNNAGEYNAVIFAPESIDTVHIVPNQLLYIDESHNIIMSSNYREAFSRLGTFAKRLQPKSIALLSATIDDDMIVAFKSMFYPAKFIEYRDKNPDRENIIYVTPKPMGYSVQDILALLEDNARRGRSAIIYTFKTESVDNIYENIAIRLIEMGYQPIPFHSKHGKKEEKLKMFSEQQSCVIATSAFGEGIDKKNVGLIIRLGFPLSITQLVQEAGRIERGMEMDGYYYMFRLGTEKGIFDFNKIKNAENILMKIPSTHYQEFKFSNFQVENTALTHFLKVGLIVKDVKVNPYYIVSKLDKSFDKVKYRGFLNAILKKDKWLKEELEDIDEDFEKHLKNAKQNGYISLQKPNQVVYYKRVRSELNEKDMGLIYKHNEEIDKEYQEVLNFFECEDKKEFLRKYYD